MCGESRLGAVKHAGARLYAVLSEHSAWPRHRTCEEEHVACSYAPQHYDISIVGVAGAGAILCRISDGGHQTYICCLWLSELCINSAATLSLFLS